MTSSIIAIEDDDKLCDICFERNKCKTFQCSICNNSVCIECFKKISISKFDFEETKKMFYDYKCPICRIETDYSFENFEKEEVINLAHKDFLNYVNTFVFNPNDETKIRFKNSLIENAKLSKQIQSNESEIKKLKVELKTTENNYKLLIMQKDEEFKAIIISLKYFVETNKNKRIDKNLLIPLYNKYI